MTKRISVDPNTGKKTVEDDDQKSSTDVPEHLAEFSAIFAFVIFVIIVGSLGAWAIVSIWQRILSAL